MEEKNTKSIKLNTVIIILIMLILIGGIVYFIFQNMKLQTINTNKENEVNQLKNTVNQLEQTINKIKDVTENIPTNSTNNNSTVNSNITNSNSIEKDNNQINTKDTESSSVNLNDSIGTWYESKNHSTDSNPNSLTIKKSSNSKLTMDLYITRIANFDNIEVAMNGNSGTFETTTDNGPSSDDQPAKINGKIEVSKNTIKLTILKSNVRNLNSGSEYRFEYKSN